MFYKQYSKKHFWDKFVDKNDESQIFKTTTVKSEISWMVKNNGDKEN